MLVQLSDVHFGYPGVEILSGVTWQLDPGCRVGLVGPNGCGKSTLLRLIAGTQTPDAGNVSRTRDCEIGYLRQSSETSTEGDLLSALLAPFSRIVELRRLLLVALQALDEHPENAAALASYGQAQHEYEMVGGDSLEHRIKEIVRDLGFDEQDLGRELRSFSGGEQGRIELARVLVRDPNLLLLDEPTNHLDIEATERLEQRLRTSRSGLVVVSHDRAFLNAVCTSMVEIAGQKLERYRGDFDQYNAQRKQRMALAHAGIEKQHGEISRLQGYIAKNQVGQRARQANSRKRALERIERIELPEDPWARSEGMKLRFAVAEHRGAREMLRAEHVTLRHGDAPPLVSDLDLVVERGDRLGIVGPNGCGKTSLLKVLVGLVGPDGGEVHQAKQVTLGHFDQQRTDLTGDHNLLEEIRSVRGDLGEETVRGILGRLRFGDDEVFRPVSSLSGGERSRLALGKLAMMPHNLLALDEPTNHLDIPAREALEEGLVGYRGTLVVVSHDRYFLDRIVTKILYFGADALSLHWANYTELRERLSRPGERTADAPPPQTTEQQRDKADRAEKREAERQEKRHLERARRRFGELEQQIASLESRLAALDESLAQGGDDWERLQQETAERQRLEGCLDEALAGWEALGTELESE